jgi:beta-mannosidase
VNLVMKDALLGIIMQQQVKVKPGVNTIPVDFQIDHPHLWWCNGLGEPYMYHFVVEAGNKKLGVKTAEVSTGLRTLKLVLDNDSLGQSFYFTVNGIPVFMKGANYVPQDVFSCRVTDEKYTTLLRDVKEAGMNMLRVWGGGLYQRDAFYNLCDRNGILIWQDFMFAGGMYPYDHEFLYNVTQEAAEQVKRLANHPCMALWCGNNECSEGWQRWGWQDSFDSKQRAEISAGYDTLFKSILPEAVKEYSQTPYWESSPRYGRGDPRHTHEGDAHNWFVWHDGEPFENYQQKVPRFMSEFGFQSMPSMETIRSFAPDTALSLTSAAMRNHQKHSRGFAIINAYMTRQYGSVPADFASFVILSQQLQSTGMVIGVQAHRNAFPYCMGSLLWQLNDCWPSISWSMIDYYGRKKIVYESVKKEFLKK